MTARAEAEDASGAELVPHWYESLYGVDLALLLASPIYFGSGVPQGDGSAVILVPGFLHGDGYLLFMYAWLQRLHYQPYYSGIGFNANCPNILIDDVLTHVLNEARHHSGQRVHLIGHSLGGVIARSLAVERPKDVASVITLGSPLRPATVHRKVFRESEMVRQYVVAQHRARVKPECMTTDCSCSFMKALHSPLPSTVRMTAVYTRHDGLVDWRSCRTGDPAIDIEVPGTHSGLAFNVSAYEVIAQRLASVQPAARAAGI